MGSISAAKGGRKPVMAYVDGDLMFIKKIAKVGASRCVFLPSEWFTLVEIQTGKIPTRIGMSIDGQVIVLKPYFGEVADDTH